MGEASEMIMEGILCQVCGGIMEDITDGNVEAPGFPRTCKACQDMEDLNND